MDGTSPARSAAIFNRPASTPARHAPEKREPAPIKIGRLVLAPAATAKVAAVASEPPIDTTLLYDPPPPDITRRAAPSPPPISSPFDTRLSAILDAPLLTGENVATGFARKERELGAAFGELHVLEARALYLRLSTPRPDDQLAQRFGRLTAERRQRLLNFLSDARRRAAVAAARR